MTGSEKKIVGVTTACHATAHFFEQAFPPVLKLVEADFGLGLAGAGGIGNIFPLFFGIGALPAGMIVDRWGSRRTLLAFLLTCAAAGIAVLFVHNLWVFAFLLMVMGLAAGLYHPAGTTLISHNVEQVGTGLGIQGMGGNLGLAVMPVIAAAVASTLGWRAAYAVLAVPAILLAMYFIVNKNLGNNRDHEPLSNEHEIARVEPVNTTRWVPLIMLFALGMLNGFCYRGMLTFLPAFFSNNSGAGQGIMEGGALTTIVLVNGVVGQYIGGRLADRLHRSALFALCFTISAPLLATLGMWESHYAVVAAALFAFLYFANQPVGNALVMELSSNSFRGRAYGIYFFMNFGMGSFSATVSGWVGERYGLDAIFPFLGAVLAGTALMGWGLVAAMSRIKRS